MKMPDMFDKRIETKGFIISFFFAIIYCACLFLFRHVLIGLEKQPGEILKPEQGQIIVMGLLIIIYHFAFTGLFAFAMLSRLNGLVAIVFSVIIHGGLLYGFKLWYQAIVNNAYFFSVNQQFLPWYAEEKSKFLLANGPLLLYLISVFLYRITNLIKKFRQRLSDIS